MQAIIFYELAFHFNPHCAEACNNLGVIYKDRDNLDKAIECYQMTLSIKPNFSQSLNNLGVVYTVQGKMDAAASMIEKAIIANPTYAEAYNNLGVFYRDAGNISLAIEAYEHCLKIDPDLRNAGQIGVPLEEARKNDPEVKYINGRRVMMKKYRSGKGKWSINLFSSVNVIKI